ncbi:MAG: DUF4912 domain-containing protein, partial [Cyanobacteria bacterium K_DeepCast_35m_m1_288]|nr:DUF4912 domain-containing protein [Cyanobacteria bacterium K_DeepCast_35m_m1_288]
MNGMAASGAEMGSSGLANLGSWTLLQLRDLAKRIGLGGYSRMDKSGLLEAVSQALPNAAPAQTQLEQNSSGSAAPELPSHITFLPRDPQWAYVFWEISSSDQQRAVAAGGTQLALRVADVTGLPLGAAHANSLQELVVNQGAREWHLPMPLSDRDYRVELGYRTAGGGWFSLATSSVARMPALEPTAVVADSFVPFSLEAPVMALPEPVSSGGVEHERFYQLATASAMRSRRVGSEVLHEWDQDSTRSVGLNDSGAGLWASGRSESGSGIVQPRSFWLVADAELIVYGATEPTAQLSIGEQQIPLDADGTFRVHVPFRDGEQLYPIKAVAADGEQERSIR